MSVYVKPNNIRVSDMCVAINNGVVNDEETLYKYLYFIVVSVARQRRIFSRWQTNSDMYEDFALYVASNLFMRMQKSAINNIMAYVSSNIYNESVDFLNKFGYRKEVFEVADISDMPIVDIDLNARRFYKVEFSAELADMCKTIRKFLAHIPYHGADYHNIYVSCLLTILHITTLSSPYQKRFKLLASKDDDKRIAYLWDRYRNEWQHGGTGFRCVRKMGARGGRTDSVVLWHLDNSFRDYIEILVRRIIKNISVDLSSMSRFEMNSKDIVADLLYNNICEDNNEHNG